MVNPIPPFEWVGHVWARPEKGGFFGVHASEMHPCFVQVALVAKVLPRPCQYSSKIGSFFSSQQKLTIILLTPLPIPTALGVAVGGALAAHCCSGGIHIRYGVSAMFPSGCREHGAGLILGSSLARLCVWGRVSALSV